MNSQYLSTETDHDLTLSIIRTETALRYPIHNLSSGESMSIEIKKTDANGAVHFLWEVSYNNKYGQPGRLAYKLDTVIINRRIDEARGRNAQVPKVLKLGTLRDIATEVGTGEGNTNAIKRALRQNAFAGLTVKGLHYKTSERIEQTFEFSDTRYGVIFTGETLPNGTKADAVYVIFHDLYLALLNSAIRRPLDYDYLKALSPTEQRFYEILSYQMMAAIKYKQRAKLRYSEYCQLSTQIRHTDLRRARDQMRIVHRPHIESGYILRDPEFQSTHDEDGQPDWFILYMPGKKAEADQLAFDFASGVPLRKKELPEATPPKRVAPVSTLPQSLALFPESMGTDIPAEPMENREILARHFYQEWNKTGSHALLTAGDRLLAEELLRSYTLDEARVIVGHCVAHARNAYPSLVTFGGARSLMGIAIANYQEKKTEQERARQRQQGKAHKDAQEAHRARFMPEYAHYVQTYLTTHCPAKRERIDAYQLHRAQERALVCKGKIRPEGPIGQSLLDAFDAPEREAERLSEFFQQDVPDFWEWDRLHNPHTFSHHTI